MSRWQPQAVLFDLDGTLIDTAADLCAAANAMLIERGAAPLPLAAFRPWVSRGGRAMLDLAFPELDDESRAALLPEFLSRYGAEPARHSRLFDGMTEVLAAIEARGLAWGIVTNKPQRLAEPVLQALRLTDRCGVLIGGDTLPVRKPDPLPLRVACERLGVAVEKAIYVGDDLRDVQAARAAGMPVIGAAWGYLAPGEHIDDWGADAVLAQPIDLLAALGLDGHG